MNPCACGCGEMVAKRMKRGHWGRLPEARAMYEDPEHRRKLAAGRRAAGNDWKRGRPVSAETRAKMAAAMRGVPRPERQGRRLGPRSEQTRAKIREARLAYLAANPASQRIEPRDGDTRQAHERIRQLIRAGLLPAARTLPCTDCGQVWAEGLSRHEYDHHHGYGAAHHGCAEVVCCRCHHAREKARGNVRKSKRAAA